MRRKSRPSETYNFDSSDNLSQEDPSTEGHSSASVSTSDPPIIASSQSSLSLSQESTFQSSNTGSELEETQLLSSHDQAESSTWPATGSEGICQSFKLDDTGAMRPREPADMFKPISPGKRRPGYLANRRSAPFIIHEDGNIALSQQEPPYLQARDRSLVDTSLQISAQPLRRTASLVKLALDSEGKAEVTARTGNTPSPPRPKPLVAAISASRRGPGLFRSLSAVEPASCSRIEHGAPLTSGRQQSLGRSRDARTWEFYCDGTARDALTKQAEREESGSATAAIGLLRSSSSNQRPLIANPNKRNAHAHKREGAKRHKTDAVKPAKSKLERTTSSVARLQTTSGNIPKQNRPATKHAKNKSQTAIFEDFEGDSDKENWQPGTQRRPEPRLRPVTSQERARILLESLHEPSQSSRLGSALGKQRSKQQASRMTSPDKEKEGPEDDDEVAAFVGEESDLDCVQNLLSLSQAAWV